MSTCMVQRAPISIILFCHPCTCIRPMSIRCLHSDSEFFDLLQTFVVSLGARGCKAWSCSCPGTSHSTADDSSKVESANATAPKVEVVDTVGAGDCLIAGFLYGYLSGACIQVCIQLK